MIAARPEPSETADKSLQKGSGATKIWVPIVLIAAILLGVAFALTIPSPSMKFGPESFFLLSVQRALMLHVILSTAEIVLLTSLVVVYVRVYSETRASFSFGLVIVLGALLVHSILSYPLVVNDIGPILLGSGLFFPYTDLLTIIAYTVFLYLSLE